MFNSKKFGEAVFAHRTKLGLSILDAAKMAVIPVQVFKEIESGNVQSVQTFAKICIWAGWIETCGDFIATNPEY